jgi:hypothetical protein
MLALPGTNFNNDRMTIFYGASRNDVPIGVTQVTSVIGLQISQQIVLLSSSVILDLFLISALICAYLY